jgi:hypothetical protein
MTTQITIHPESAYESLSPYQTTRVQAPAIEGGALWGQDGFSFADMLDVVNPLQHLPGISAFYRSLTGDTISSGAKLAGGALFGGPIGFVVALANEIFESATGHDMAGSMLAALTGEDKEKELAQIDSPGTPSPVNRSAYEAYKLRQSMMG